MPLIRRGHLPIPDMPPEPPDNPRPKLVVIAGLNGVGKTTLTERILVHEPVQVRQWALVRGQAQSPVKSLAGTLEIPDFRRHRIWLFRLLGAMELAYELPRTVLRRG